MKLKLKNNKIKFMKLLKRQFDKFYGLTLVEMIVSISMIVIIAALFIANYQSINKRSDLIMTAQNLVADLHYAQNNTLGLSKYNGVVPSGGWGVHFDTASSSNYVIFADLNGPGEIGYMSYDDGEGYINYGARLIELPPNIYISSITIGAGTTTMSNVTFLPPDPKTNIYDGSATSTLLKIELTENKNNSTKTIQVNFLGLIEVID